MVYREVRAVTEMNGKTKYEVIKTGDKRYLVNRMKLKMFASKTEEVAACPLKNIDEMKEFDFADFFLSNLRIIYASCLVY